jgi:hypothetical protein
VDCTTSDALSIRRQMVMSAAEREWGKPWTRAVEKQLSFDSTMP